METEEQPYLEAKVSKDNPSEVSFVLLGRRLVVRHESPAAAEVMARCWSDHLEEQWQHVRETNSSIIEAFAEKLKLEGVCEDLIQKAMEAVRADAMKMSHGG